MGYRIASVRPLVRYVDEDRAVIETHFAARPPLPEDPTPKPRSAMLQLELDSQIGFHDETLEQVDLDEATGMIRFEVVHPDRWYPAGLGEQSLYQLRLTLIVDDEPIDQWEYALGMTSIRRRNQIQHDPADAANDTWLINGEDHDFQNVIHIDKVHRNMILPLTGDSLMVIRDHYGEEGLFTAADCAGIVAVQCIPIHQEGIPEREIQSAIHRLVAHPSLAGYYVGHLGDLSERIATRIQQLDPTRPVYRHLPQRYTPPPPPA